MSSPEEIAEMQRIRNPYDYSYQSGRSTGKMQNYLDRVYAAFTNKHVTVELPCPHCGETIKIRADTDVPGDISLKIECDHKPQRTAGEERC